MRRIVHATSKIPEPRGQSALAPVGISKADKGHGIEFSQKNRLTELGLDYHARHGDRLHQHMRKQPDQTSHLHRQE